MKHLNLLLSLFALALLLPSCLFKKDKDCNIPNQKATSTIFVNMVGNNEFCLQVSEGYEIFLDWPYIYDGDVGSSTFTFEGTEGFIIDEGMTRGRQKPSMRLIATKDSPAESTIQVYAENDCGESSRGTAKVYVRKETPYVFNPRLTLTENVRDAATFTYKGKGYIAAGLRGATGTDYPTYVFDPADNSIEELPGVFAGAEVSAAVYGDTAFLTNENGGTVRVYHIPTNTLVRDIKAPHAHLNETRKMKTQLMIYNDKLFVGPIYESGVKLLSYNIKTGQWKTEQVFHSNPQIYGRTSFQLDNRMYYFFSNNDGYVFNPVLNTLQAFNGVGGFENYTTSFVVNGQAYVATEDHYYKFDPANYSHTPFEMFNGNSCFIRGWYGPAWSTSSFTLGSRVYFAGGAVSEFGGGTKYFAGVQF